MDPISQAVFGCTASASIAKKDTIKPALLCGIVGGTIADLDILIRSHEDSLLAIEFHRHFSHSIFFIPVGALIVATLCFFLLRKKVHFKSLAIFSVASFATHGFLDACTSYGTLLLWPVYNKRIAFDNISIIDPFFTFPLIILILAVVIKRDIKFARYAFIYAFLYLSLGFVQKLRVESYITNIANSQGHKIEKLKLNPTLGNIILWRSVYKSGDKYYINAVRMPIFGKVKIYPGSPIQYIEKDKLIKSLPSESLLRKDINKFVNFSQGFIYFYPYMKNVIGDLRYGTLPNNDESLWGIKINPNHPNRHAQYLMLRNLDDIKINKFKSMLKGESF